MFEVQLVVVVVYIFRYFRLYLQKSIKKIKKREEAEPQGQALAKRTCRGGETNKQKNVISKERRAMQAGSGGNIDRVEKQLGLKQLGLKQTTHIII